MFEKQVRPLAVLIWNAVALVALAPGARSGYALVACVMLTFGVLVDSSALTPVAATWPSLRSVTVSALHSFGSTRPLPVPTCEPAIASVAAGLPMVTLSAWVSCAPQLSAADARTA